MSNKELDYELIERINATHFDVDGFDGLEYTEIDGGISL